MCLLSMEKAEKQLESLLKSIEGLENKHYSDHHSGQWVQTTLYIKNGEKYYGVGILDHVWWGDLTAKIYNIDRVKPEIQNTYITLIKRLKKIGYKIKELPANEHLESHIMMW